MALDDDVRRLAAEEPLYLTHTASAGAADPGGVGHRVVYRGRLRQALNGNWVFDTSTGSSGVVGILLGPETAMWSSQEAPGMGLR